MANTIKLHGHDYELINPKTQRARGILHAFLGSYDSVLSDVYGRFSRAKENAYNYCRSRECEFHSYDGVITSYNTCIFTYAFSGLDENGKRWLIYITPSHDYAIDYEAI